MNAWWRRSTLALNRKDTLRVSDPQVRPCQDQPKLSGVPLIVRFGLTIDETRRLAAAEEAAGMLGPHPYFLYAWELVDLQGVYRVARVAVRSVRAATFPRDRLGVARFDIWSPRKSQCDFNSL